MDPARSATQVRVLTGVLFHVSAFNVNAEHFPIFQFHVDKTILRNWIFRLRNLVCLRQVRIEIMFPGKGSDFRNFTVQRQTEADRGFQNLPVEHWHAARQTKGCFRDVRVRFPAERVGGGIENLGVRPQFHVDFNP